MNDMKHKLEKIIEKIGFTVETLEPPTFKQVMDVFICWVFRKKLVYVYHGKKESLRESGEKK